MRFLVFRLFVLVFLKIIYLMHLLKHLHTLLLLSMDIFLFNLCSVLHLALVLGFCESTYWFLFFTLVFFFKNSQLFYF